MLRFLFLLFLTVPAAAQQPVSYILKGYLGVAGGESFTYRLEFKDSSGFISGYSYTYMWEKNEIKATIAGFIDRDKKTIAFRETGIVYNHGFQSNITICLLDVLLKYREEGGAMMLAGPFKSADAGDVYCGKGTVSFTGNAIIDGLFVRKGNATTPAAPPQPPSVKPPARSPMRVVYDTLPKKQVTVAPPPSSSNEPAKITAGTEKTYEWNTSVIDFSIWDGGWIDGDVVTILFDDQTIAKNYPLVAARKTFSFSLDDKETHTITIIANHEGSELPNTANIELQDGNLKYNLIAYNAIGKRAVIKVRKK